MIPARQLPACLAHILTLAVVMTPALLAQELIVVAAQTNNYPIEAAASVATEDITGTLSPETKTSKFNTEAMVGPLADSNSLFSSLEISERYESYAAHVPANRTREEDFVGQNPWPFDTYTWISPVFYYQPLYFEQPNLERYGLGTKRCLQPAASSIHFFGSIPLVPYKVLTQHPCEKYYTLGNNRPGDCVPFQRGTILGQSHVGEFLYYWCPGSGY